MGEALRRWREQLEAWAIPEEILGRAPAPPWEFPAEPFRHRAREARAATPSPSTRAAREALPDGGTVLDVGAGAGAASLPLAPPASLLVGVDPSAELLDEFASLAREAGVRFEAIAGPWPDVAPRAPEVDVVVCHHVLYNVADLAPLVDALTGHARRRVVVEISAEHPVAWTRDLWWRFHRLPRPEGPTADDLVAALVEVGVRPHRIDAEPERRTGGFARREDAVAFARTRLCLAPDRDREVEEALGDDLVEHDGRFAVGRRGTVVTLWWDRP